MSQTNQVLNLEVQFKLVECPSCGITYAIPEILKREHQRDHRTLYCPRGHRWYYPRESDLESLERQLKDARSSKKFYEHRTMELSYSNRSIRGHLTRKKKELHRISNGICPCCNRHFVNLERHMATKHPNYVG